MIPRGAFAPKNVAWEDGCNPGKWLQDSYKFVWQVWSRNNNFLPLTYYSLNYFAPKNVQNFILDSLEAKKSKKTEGAQDIFKNHPLVG